MKNFLLIVIIIVCGVAAYHLYNRSAQPPAPVVVEEATPVPTPRKVTPKPSTSTLNVVNANSTPRPSGLSTTGLQTHSLNGNPATPEKGRPKH